LASVRSAHSARFPRKEYFYLEAPRAAPNSAMLNPAISEIGAAPEPVMDNSRCPAGRALGGSALRQASLFASLLSNLAWTSVSTSARKDSAASTEAAARAVKISPSALKITISGGYSLDGGSYTTPSRYDIKLSCIVVVVYDQSSSPLQPGARKRSYSSTLPQNAKYLISSIENFLINCRFDRFASFIAVGR
jgi:hypothetical protein